MHRDENSITSLPDSPGEDRRRRMQTYFWLMIARVVCLLVFIVVPGWWKLIPAIGAVFIPYFAVTLANAIGVFSKRGTVEIPNALTAPPPSAARQDGASRDEEGRGDALR